MNRFHVIMWMATVAFAEASDFVATEALLAIASVPGVTSIAIPDYPSFDLSHWGQTKTGSPFKCLLESLRRLRG